MRLAAKMEGILCCRRANRGGRAREQALRAKLLKPISQKYVQNLGSDQYTVEAEVVRASSKKSKFDALSTRPVTLEVLVPANYEPGQALVADGPHGKLEVPAAPADAAPGAVLQFKLAPPAEFRLEVPPGAKPGSSVRVQRADGVEVAVSVPEGLKPGDSFEVMPPVLMVLVPNGAASGDFVAFKCGDDEWLRARVPDGLRPGAYFTARMPPPGRAKVSSSNAAAPAAAKSAGARQRRRGG